MATETACTPELTSSCKVNCSLNNVAGPQTCTDDQVAVAPQQYDYAITLISSDGKAEELPSSNDRPYRITVAIPPPNMVLVHRDSVNYQHCQMMSRTSDPLNNQRCAITGSSMIGATPYNTNPGGGPLNLSTGYYDFGYNLFVDRWTAACNWDSYGTGAPSGATSGSVYYDANSGTCHVKQSGSWLPASNSSLTAASRALSYTITPSTTNRRPPLTNVGQNHSYETCQSVTVNGYGAKRLLRRREFIAAAAWPSLSGEPNAMDNTTLRALESPSAGNHAGGTFACNTDVHNGIANAAFNSPSYELSRNTAAGPDSFTIGSTGTKNCVSRFGLQDHIGNVWQWTSDQLVCDPSSTKVCSGIKSALDSGNGYGSGFDLNGFKFDGIQGPGGVSFNVSTWTIANGNFNAANFNTALGLPLVGNDYGNALSVSSFSANLRDDQFVLDNSSGGTSRGMLSGGTWNSGANAGRWLGRFALDPSTYFDSIGFRCALAAE
jgi:hypothetical protein